MPFEQVHSHCTLGSETSPGTGLGLSISNHLVELMQSQLLIESAPNLGTNIHFAVAFSRSGLPIESLDKAKSQNHRIHFKNIRTLIVEDHPANRHILWMQLQALNIFADQCSNGEEAIHLLQKHKYDLVITDHSMPGMHGIELAKKIRAIFQDQPIIIGITADIYAQQSHAFFLDSGMDAVLIKPISLEALEKQVNTLLQVSIKSNSGNSLGINPDMNILILTEVLKVQNEVILSLELNSDAGLLDESQLDALIHKVKGGAILSEAVELHTCCLNLEKSQCRIADKKKYFKEALLMNNAVLEKQIQDLKEKL
jgi:two-component system sensor histidine kinase EvgS